MSTSAPGRHLAALAEAFPEIHRELPRLEHWGQRLATDLPGGGRLLAAGNGGSAAEAQHLTAELVGRYRHDRPPVSALALHAETSSLTAITNDYGAGEAFARQVRAHGRAGDYLVLLSTSGRSTNLLRAAEAGHQAGLTVWALTGPAPNLLAGLVDDALAIGSHDSAVVQELHLVAIHLVCEAFDACLADSAARRRAAGGEAPAPSSQRTPREAVRG